jgi:hypothetical protein
MNTLCTVVSSNVDKLGEGRTSAPQGVNSNVTRETVRLFIH